MAPLPPPPEPSPLKARWRAWREHVLGVFFERKTVAKPMPLEPGTTSMSGAGQMFFRLNQGELPTAVQFLSTSERSGELLITFDGVSDKGSIWFVKGQIVHAQWGDVVDVEAVARMINRGRAVARFHEGRTPPVCTLSTPTSHLLLGASVMADEGGGATAAPPEEAPETVTRLRPRPVFAVLLGVAIVAVIGYYGFWAWHSYQLSRERRVAQARQALQARERAALLVTEARKASGERRYSAAQACLTEALRLEPAQADAKDLAGKIPSPAKLEDVIPAKSRAEEVWDKVGKLGSGQGVGPEAQRINDLFAQANRLFVIREHRGAVEAYGAVETAAKQLLMKGGQRDQAGQVRALAVQEKSEAQAAGAAEKAPIVWRNAVALEEEANKAFESGRFEDAPRLWKAAADEFAKAEAQVRNRGALGLAKAAYEQELARFQLASLEQYGGDRWTEVRRLASDATKLDADGQLEAAARKWDQARERVAAAAEYAESARIRAQYDQAMAEGGRLLSMAKWPEAEAVFLKALQCPGFEQDPVAKQRLGQAQTAMSQDVGRHLQLAEAACAKSDWAAAWPHVEAILARDPTSAQALQLRDAVMKNLPPVVTITAELNGQAVAGAEVVIDGAVQSGRTPLVCTWINGQSYQVEVRLPDRDNQYFTPFAAVVRADRPGKQALRAKLGTVSAPAIGQSFTVPGLGLALTSIQPGAFRRTFGEAEAGGEALCTATLGAPFWMGKFEVTQAQYETLMASNPSHFKGASLPVESVSWQQAVDFCARLTERERQGKRLPSGYVYRLPSEFEWEYVCRAASGGDFAGDVDAMAWHSGNSDKRVHEVGTKAPNAWGVHDMHGNVWEWCLDFLGDNPAEARTGAKGRTQAVALDSTLRARRGGCWLQPAYYCRSQVRFGMKADSELLTLGLRVVLAPTEPQVHCEWSAIAAAGPAAVGGPALGKPWGIPDLGLDMVPVPAGRFAMGAANGAPDEKPIHAVRIGTAFWMASCETTQAQYERLMGRNPSCFSGPSRPVEGVSWLDSMAFCAKLTAAEKAKNRLPAGYVYRLPTEAEWEYACRAGTTGDFSGDLERMGWYRDNSGNRTGDVNSLAANAWGLYQMHGNVREWCIDWKAPYPEGRSDAIDPVGPASGWCRVARGGSWDLAALDCRSPARDCFWPAFANGSIGFRVTLGPVLQGVAIDPALAEAGARSKPGSGAHAAVWTVPDLDLAMVAVFPSAASGAAGASARSATGDGRLMRPFWIGRFEVTQDQYQAVSGQNPSRLKGASLPVETVSWVEAAEFCRRLTERERTQGRLPGDFVYRLPTEMEWEYCCQAGGEEPDAAALNAAAWNQTNSQGRPQPVGGRRGNAWGISDMLGNVWEWCKGWSPPRTPGAASGSDRDLGPVRPYRGGSWYNTPSFCRSMQRVEASPLFRHGTVGFRIVLAYERPQ